MLFFQVFADKKKELNLVSLFKNSDDDIRQLDYERQRAMNEFKSKRDAEHKVVSALSVKTIIATV